MEDERPLEGGCSCGRNMYKISIPSDAPNTAQVLFDQSPGNHHAESSLVPTFLRVPLPWIQSTTYAFYPDETHGNIRRVFTPRHSPQTKRHFCGFCGTLLTYWSEENSDEAGVVYISMESLGQSSMARLGEGTWETALPIEEAAEEEGEKSLQESEMAITSQGRKLRGVPWFEEMVQGSALGRMRRRRGGETARDGSTSVEWEIVEFEGDEGEDDVSGTTTTKRKIGEIGGSEDVPMRGHVPR